MDEITLPVIDSVFFPYYVNQNRLLDIYAILNRAFLNTKRLKKDRLQENLPQKEVPLALGLRFLSLG